LLEQLVLRDIEGIDLRLRLSAVWKHGREDGCIHQLLDKICGNLERQQDEKRDSAA
jgi:hypothetical protein